MRNGHFVIKRERVIAGPFAYWTYRVSGWLRGRRVRKQFKSEAEAIGAKARYEIDAANAATSGLNQIRQVNTALGDAQVREAEAAFHRLGERSLSFAVDWFLEHYRPPVVAAALSVAVLAFREDRTSRISFYVARDYKRELAALESSFPRRQVHGITTEELQAYNLTQLPS